MAKTSRSVVMKKIWAKKRRDAKLNANAELPKAKTSAKTPTLTLSTKLSSLCDTLDDTVLALETRILATIARINNLN
jgi:hypothetical protein